MAVGCAEVVRGLGRDREAREIAQALPERRRGRLGRLEATEHALRPGIVGRDRRARATGTGRRGICQRWCAEIIECRTLRLIEPPDDRLTDAPPRHLRRRRHLLGREQLAERGLHCLAVLRRHPLACDLLLQVVNYRRRERLHDLSGSVGRRCGGALPRRAQPCLGHLRHRRLALRCANLVRAAQSFSSLSDHVVRHILDAGDQRRLFVGRERRSLHARPPSRSHAGDHRVYCTGCDAWGWPGEVLDRLPTPVIR